MYARLVADNDFSKKLIFLPDLCHKIENWLNECKPTWLENLLKETMTLITTIKKERELDEILNQLNTKNLGIRYYGLKSLVATRFAQFTYEHINSILKNVEAIIECCQNTIAAQEEEANVINVAKNVLKTITNVNFFYQNYCV